MHPNRRPIVSNDPGATVADERTNQREGLSLRTLVIAAIASGIAAVVVSQFWRNGTVFAAAMTPVFVAIVKELLERPMESEVVRRSASKVSQVAVAPLKATTRTGSGRATETAPPAGGRNGSGHSDVVMAGPRRTYSAGDDSGGDGFLARLRNLRGRRLKIAIVTGLLAFVVAAAAFTLPELIFGGSVSSSGRTTFFGGGSDSAEEKARDENRDGESGGSSQPSDPDSDPAQPQDGGESTEEEPAAPEEEQAPEESEPAPSSEEPAPPPENGGSPVPPVPAPEAPTP